MTRRWKAVIATGIAGLALAATASPAVANDGISVKADSDPDASAKLHLDGGAPTKAKVG
jgi:hypothetical protein